MWLGLLTTGLIYAVATSPWMSQGLPRFLLPVLAAAGAILIVAALVRSLARLVRARRSHGRLDVIPVAVNAGRR